MKEQAYKWLLINSVTTLVDNRYTKNARNSPNPNFAQNVGTSIRLVVSDVSTLCTYKKTQSLY